MFWVCLLLLFFPLPFSYFPSSSLLLASPPLLFPSFVLVIKSIFSSSLPALQTFVSSSSFSHRLSNVSFFYCLSSHALSGISEVCPLFFFFTPFFVSSSLLHLHLLVFTLLHLFIASVLLLFFRLLKNFHCLFFGFLSFRLFFHFILSFFILLSFTLLFWKSQEKTDCIFPLLYAPYFISPPALPSSFLLFVFTFCHF